MSPAEWGLLFGIIAHSIAVLAAIVKLVTWVTGHITVNEERVKHLEHQVNNDITGRRVVAGMREDVAQNKVEITGIRDDIKELSKKLDRMNSKDRGQS